MITDIKTQEELNNFIQQTPMIGNIYYNEETEYIPIDWSKEYVRLTDIDGKYELQRIKY